MNSEVETGRRASRRRKVVALIRELGRPFTAEQIWKICSAWPDRISRATLYRILRALRDKSILKFIVLPNGRQVAVCTEARTFCIVECLDCGNYIDCPKLQADLCDWVEHLQPSAHEAAVYLRSGCPHQPRCYEAKPATP